MKTIAKYLAAAVLVIIAMACFIGVLATFEPPGWLGWRIGYSLAGLLCVVGAIWLVIRR